MSHPHMMNQSASTTAQRIHDNTNGTSVANPVPTNPIMQPYQYQVNGLKAPPYPSPQSNANPPQKHPIMPNQQQMQHPSINQVSADLKNLSVSSRIGTPTHNLNQAQAFRTSTPEHTPSTSTNQNHLPVSNSSAMPQQVLSPIEKMTQYSNAIHQSYSSVTPPIGNSHLTQVPVRTNSALANGDAFQSRVVPHLIHQSSLPASSVKQHVMPPSSLSQPRLAAPPYYNQQQQQQQQYQQPAMQLHQQPHANQQAQLNQQLQSNYPPPPSLPPPAVVDNGRPSGEPSSANRTSVMAKRYPAYPSTSSMPQNQYGAAPPPPATQPQPYPPQPQYQPHQPPYPTAAPAPQHPTAYQQHHTHPQHPAVAPPQANSVTATGFNRMWGAESFDLLQTPNILPPNGVEVPPVMLGQPNLNEANCSPDIFRCTLTKIPENASLLQKSRLPLGVLIHPFKDLNHLAVIQCTSIVRCRSCRTYINPFVYFVDNKRWKCNLCYRVNELPEEFQYDPVTKTYGDPSRRPEVRASTIEYIAPAEYMLRPPQPAVYLFMLDVSRLAVESGYLRTVCAVLLEELDRLPGDARTQVGFLAYDTTLHFFSLPEPTTATTSIPREMIIWDIDDVFLPSPDNLLVNLHSRLDVIRDLLTQLPTRYTHSYETGSCLGAALQAAHKLMGSTGGRVTVFQATLPTIGPGALTAREDPNARSGGVSVPHLNPANDFYKRLALEFSGQQIAVDLFLLNSQYIDIATISGISKFSGGSIYHFPLFKASRQLQNVSFARSLRRYLCRKIGFEAVMRVRCSRGLGIHAFHGNFFVRSTDLLSLPNVSPDAAFGMQVSIDESLSDVQTVCFQAALLYTSSKAERRIRVHTLCIPVASTLSDIIHSADQQCIIGLLSKMAVDRSIQSSLSDAKDAFLNAAIDILSSYRLSQNIGSGGSGSSLLAPKCLRLLPLYIAALLRHPAFRVGVSTRLDDRVKAMCDLKTLPLTQLMLGVYPDLYPVHNLHEQPTITDVNGSEEQPTPAPPRLQLTARSVDSTGAYLLDSGDHMLLFVCPAVSAHFLTHCLGIPDYNAIPDDDCAHELPALDNEYSRRLQAFIAHLNEDRPLVATIRVLRENSPLRGLFLERLVEDRLDTALSYHEFLQHLKTQLK